MKQEEKQEEQKSKEVKEEEKKPDCSPGGASSSSSGQDVTGIKRKPEDQLRPDSRDASEDLDMGVPPRHRGESEAVKKEACRRW